jgi:membrane protein implicated in regulation of membrane protease activity
LTFAYWLGFAVAMASLELFVATSFLLWFAMGSAIVAAFTVFFPNATLTSQILVWAVGTILTLIVWQRYGHRIHFLPQRRIGASLFQGEIGTVITSASADTPGIVRFARTIAGRYEWTFDAPRAAPHTPTEDNPLCPGDRVLVTDVTPEGRLVLRAFGTPVRPPTS